MYLVGVWHRNFEMVAN